MHGHLAQQLPPPLRMELEINIKRQVLEAVTLFRQCMPAAVLDVMQRLQSQIAVDRQVVLAQGTLPGPVFFVKVGAARPRFVQAL